MTHDCLHRYSVRFKVLRAVQYGSAQVRERLLLLATLKGYPILEHP